MTDLANRALLVTLNISQWTARKLDKRESIEVNLKHGTTVDAARVNKALLPMSAPLDKVHKLTGSIRNEYYQMSLPWMEGQQIIKAEGYMGFAQHFAARKLEWESAVESFLKSYADSIVDAQYLLGTMFDPSDYPPVSDLRHRFRMDIGFYPVPNAADWRVEMADDEMRKLQDRIAADVTDRQGDAMKAAWKRVHEVVTKMQERLSKPDNIFRDSLVENARALCAILPSLNISDDPKLEDIRQEIEASLYGVEPDDLRKHPEVREEVSDAMADILSKMSAMYGA